MKLLKLKVCSILSKLSKQYSTKFYLETYICIFKKFFNSCLGQMNRISRFMGNSSSKYKKYVHLQKKIQKVFSYHLLHKLNKLIEGTQ